MPPCFDKLAQPKKQQKLSKYQKKQVNNQYYNKFVDKMEGSMVRLRIAEKEARLKTMAAAKEYKKPENGYVNVKDGKYYLVRLEMEIEKLKSLIDESEKDNRLGQLPEEASGKIRNAVGKAQLLINKRFKQFEELCRDNIENNPDKKETKATDLQGYWEMMNIQIDDVNSLFKDIDNIRANNWRIPEPDKPNGIPGGKSSARKSVTPKGKTRTGKSPRPKQNNTDDEKAKQEARNRLAAARKQAKLRQKQLRDEEEQANKNSPDNSLNSSLNSSLNVSFEVLDESPKSESPVSEIGEQESSINIKNTNGHVNEQSDKTDINGSNDEASSTKDCINSDNNEKYNDSCEKMNGDMTNINGNHEIIIGNVEKINGHEINGEISAY